MNTENYIWPQRLWHTRSSLVSDGGSHVGPQDGGGSWPPRSPIIISSVSGGVEASASPPALQIVATSVGGSNGGGGVSPPVANNNKGEIPSPTRLKRITNTDSVFTMCQTPEGPKFQCAMCARVFNLKCTLLRHVRHQHQGRFVPHPCKTCGQIFKRTDHLKVHMKKIHNVILPNTMNNHTTPNSSPLVNSV